MRSHVRGTAAGLLLAAGSAGAQPPAVPPAVPPALPPTTPATPPAMPATGAPPAAGAPATPTAPATPPKPFEWPTVVAGKTLEKWLLEFKSSDPTVRDQAVKVLPLFGAEAVRKSAVKPLLALIEDPDPGVRINAILVISAVGFEKAVDVQTAATKLAAAIQVTRPGSMIRLHATRCLAGLGPEAHKAIPALLEASDDPSWETRQAIAAALGRVGAGVYKEVPVSFDGGLTSDAMPKLERPPNDLAMQRLNFKMINDPSAAVRLEACQSLVVMGPPVVPPAEYPAKARPYIDKVAARLANEKDTGVKVWLQLLAIMYDDRRSDAVIKDLMNQAGAADPLLRLQSLQALAVLGPRAKTALPSITSAMFAPDNYVALAGITTLMSLGADAKAAIPDLEKLAKETKDKDIKALAEKAIELLRKMKDPPPAAAAPPRRQ